MRNALIVVTTWFIVSSLCLTGPARAQDGTDTEVTFTESTNEAAADHPSIDAATQQLQRILAEYDLDPWIITQDVRIKPGVDPHSRPVLTLNTEYLDDDLAQLSIFVHEQAHWLPREKRKAAVKDLQVLYPDIPGVPVEYKHYAGTEDATYHHLIVGWTELDAMVELVGETQARRIVREKLDRFDDRRSSAPIRSYFWYYERVLEDTEQIGEVLAKHDLLITPDKGL